jgi:o-succinylbenzoate---CoA ligase
MSASQTGAIQLTEIPPGAAGVEAARRVLDDILAGSDQVWAPVTNLDQAASVLQPAQPIEDPRTRLIMLTSGSTGDPKGVCLSRESIVSSAALVTGRYPEDHDAPGIIALPVTSAGGLGVLIRAILGDTAVVTVPTIGGGGTFTATVFCDAVAPVLDQGPVVSLVPTQLAILMEHARSREVLTRMRRILLGGAAASADLLRKAGDSGINAVVTYGMTETCGGCVHNGVPLDGVDVQVDAGGRIHLSGPMVAHGYRLRPEESRESFTSHTFHTGDVGAWRDGRLSVLGRIDDIVQVKGVNVGLGAVEGVLLEHPRVVDAVVVAVPDERDGSRLIACIVANPAGTAESKTPAPETTDLSAQLHMLVRAALGSPAVPYDIRQVRVLPYLPNGKIDRRTVQRNLSHTTPHA